MYKIINLALALLIAVATPAFSGQAPTTFDVAEDLSRFVFASSPVFDDGNPAYGNAFVTQGYIYPDGTLDSGVEGTKKDGTPAFPDLVIGTWTCNGHFVGKGMRTKTGTFVITRQVFQFNNGDIVITQGPEVVDVNVEIERPITGATGDFKSVGDVMVQTLLGMSDGYGARLQFKIPSSNQNAALNVQ